MRATVRLNDELASHVDDVRQDSETSDAEAVRECLRRSEQLDEVENELEHERARAEDLRRQLAEANSKNDDLDELARYVQDERTAEQRRRQAGLVTRAKWFLVGMDVDEEDE